MNDLQLEEVLDAALSNLLEKDDAVMFFKGLGVEKSSDLQHLELNDLCHFSILSSLVSCLGRKTSLGKTHVCFVISCFMK